MAPFVTWSLNYKRMWPKEVLLILANCHHLTKVAMLRPYWNQIGQTLLIYMALALAGLGLWDLELSIPNSLFSCYLKDLFALEASFGTTSLRASYSSPYVLVRPVPFPLTFYLLSTRQHPSLFLLGSHATQHIKDNIVWLSLIWDTDWLNTVTWSTNISVCCPPQSCGGGTLIDTTHFFTQTNGKLSLRYYRFKHVCWPS